MDPISAIASLIAVYQLASSVSGLCFRYGQGVQRADRDADLVINELDTFQKYLRTLKEILEKEDSATDGTHRLRNLNGIINGESAALKLCGRNLEDIRAKLVKVQSEGRFREAIHKLSWPLKQEEVNRTLNALKRFAEAVDRALNVDNNEIMREIDSTTKRIQNSLESAESQHERDREQLQLSQEQRGADEIKEKILDWLSHPDPSEIHEMARHDRNDQARTGRWFLNGNAFQEFKATPRSVLWLHGDSGCGKSVLCSAIIDEIVAIRARHSQTALAYWYFSATDKNRTSVDNLLRALIVQLVFRYPTPPCLLDLWDARKMGRESPKRADLVQTLKRLLVAAASHKYFIVIDALDESDETERGELMQLIRSLVLLEADIHILVTSRTLTVGVEKGMKGLTGFYKVAIEGLNADLDISSHVTERLENDRALAKWSPELRKAIKETLIEDAGGMFRWVECQLQAVRKCRKPAEVRKTLRALPKTLHEVYARDLAKVDENASQDVIRLLEWLAFPQRKLRIEEAVDMLAVDMESDPPAFDEENRMVDSEEVLKMCGSLVRLDINAEDQNDKGDAARVQTISAAHSSVIDFLRTQPIKVGMEEAVILSRSQANLRMAETCLIYLRYFHENGIILTKDNIARYPFARVSALTWDRFHRDVLASSERVDVSRLNGLVMELFSSPTATLNWVKLSDPDKGTQGVALNTEISQVKPVIYYAAQLGLLDIVRHLIEEGNSVDQLVGPPFGTPLVAACAMGSTDVASLLLDSGADPNLSGYFYYGTPLAAAIGFGWIEIVELLLGRKGVDINGTRHPPVQATEETLERLDEYQYLPKRTDEFGYKRKKSRCLEIATELIELAKKADTRDWGNEMFKDTYGHDETLSADSHNQSSDSPQSAATDGNANTDCAVSGNLDETYFQKLLVRADAASNRITCSTEGLVYIAADGSNLEILKILLAAGADPNLRGGDYGTALQMACARNYEEVVSTLLKNGARTDVYGGYLGSSLNAACSFGSVRTVEYLIKAGVDVNRFDVRHSSPLCCASGQEQADVVKLLLKNGAATDLCPDNEDTPLLVAAKIGNIEIAQILLDAGSDVNRQGSTRATPLYVACGNRDKAMVQLLLAHGANPNIQQCGTYDHALQRACQNAEEEIVSLLLESGAKTDLCGGYFGNALQAACASESKLITQMLLSHGADINLGDWNFGSPLVTACGAGDLEIAKYLVEAGADAHATDLIGHSALLMTIISQDARLDAFDYIIGLGLDPSLGDKRGCNGLHYAARARKGDLIKKMLESQINVNATDSNGWSPLHWAAASTEYSAEIIRSLLQSGCDKTMRDKQDRTALDLATLFQRTEEITILDDMAQAYTKPFEDDKSGVLPTDDRVCDGCGIKQRHCKPESWHHCTNCLDYDFCFRCVLDKDTIHFKDHVFPSEPA